MKHPFAQQRKAGLSIALAFNQFQFGDMALNHTIVDPPSEPCTGYLRHPLQKSGEKGGDNHVRDGEQKEKGNVEVIISGFFERIVQVASTGGIKMGFLMAHLSSMSTTTVVIPQL